MRTVVIWVDYARGQPDANAARQLV